MPRFNISHRCGVLSGLGPQIRRGAGLGLVVLAVAAASTPAQQSRPPRERPLADTAALRRLVEILAADSMAGRPTPSAELDAAAEFVASEFRTAGLEPLGDGGGYLQRYPLALSLLDTDSARIEIGASARWRLGAWFYAGGAGRDPTGVLRGQAVVVSGPVTRENSRRSRWSARWSSFRAAGRTGPGPRLPLGIRPGRRRRDRRHRGWRPARFHLGASRAGPRRTDADGPGAVAGLGRKGSPA